MSAARYFATVATAAAGAIATAVQREAAALADDAAALAALLGDFVAGLDSWERLGLAAGAVIGLAGSVLQPWGWW